MQQGSKTVSHYAINFRILAAESGWGYSTLQTIFLQGLSGDIKDELAVREDYTSLNQLIDLAIRLDNRMRERSEPGCHQLPTPAPGVHTILSQS